MARKMHTLFPSASEAGLALSDWTPGFPVPAPWDIQELKVRDQLALAKAIARLGEHELGTMVPLRRIDGRWFVTLPPHAIDEDAQRK